MVYVFGTLNIEKSLIKYWTNNDPDNKSFDYEMVRCNHALFHPEVVFVYEAERYFDSHFNLYFYNVKNIFSASRGNREYTGTTTVINTTFPELVTIVKEGCAQFRVGYGDYQSGKLNWLYTEPDPEKTPDTSEEDERIGERSEWLHDYKVSIGQIEPEPVYDSLEEALRAGGVLEEAIKEMVEEAGYEYVGPQ